MTVNMFCAFIMAKQLMKLHHIMIYDVIVRLLDWRQSEPPYYARKFQGSLVALLFVVPMFLFLHALQSGDFSLSLNPIFLSCEVFSRLVRLATLYGHSKSVTF